MSPLWRNRHDSELDQTRAEFDDDPAKESLGFGGSKSEFLFPAAACISVLVGRSSTECRCNRWCWCEFNWRGMSYRWVGAVVVLASAGRVRDFVSFGGTCSGHETCQYGKYFT